MAGMATNLWSVAHEKPIEHEVLRMARNIRPSVLLGCHGRLWGRYCGRLDGWGLGVSGRTKYRDTAPERIWLQISDSTWDADSPFPHDSEVTWCQDSVMALEVKYLRYDLAEKAIKRALSVMDDIWNTKGRDDDYVYDEMGSDLSGAYFELRDLIQRTQK
jgi:hypothetical protein